MGLCTKVPTTHILAIILGSLEIGLFGGVIFGWHSVVYVYKETGYFSDGCSAEKSLTPSANVTWQYHTPGTGTPLNSSHDNATPNGTVIRSDNMTTTTLHDSGYSNQGNSIHYDDLSCEEKIQVQSETGVSQVCKSQDEQFNLVFSLATSINGILSFPSGILYDRLGTRISRIFSLVTFLAGQLCLIFASSAKSYLLYPGFIGLVYGGYQILLTNLQLSCLIPSLRSTIMSLYAGSYDTSSSVFLLFKAAHEGGVSVNTSFAVQASLYFLIFVSSTFCLLPKTRIPFSIPNGYRLKCWLCHKFCRKEELQQKENSTTGEWKMDETGSIVLCRDASNSADNLDGEREDAADVQKLTEGDAGNGAYMNYQRRVSEPGERNAILTTDKRIPDIVISDTTSSLAPPSDKSAEEGEDKLLNASSKKRKTFRQVALSRLFLTDLLWMSVQRLRSWIFVGIFNPWITRLACGDKALVSHYTSVYAGLQFFGILTAPLSGRLMDRKIKGGEKYGNPRYERLHASIASFVLNSTVSVVLTVGTLIPVLELQYVTFVLHCLHRSFLYGPNSAFVANAFPSEHFGKLFGITLTVSALFSTIQYPLFLIMQGPLNGDPMAINIFLLVLMVISYVHPIYIWCYLQRKLSKIARAV
ncbi:equilibrative nucleobase transporter 1-like [Littorina saxatilis]|uniref:Solute carrier family 43 member 3 n=1 Tax=Littorina saxatilis TaxID=31220 RepID=A0AAN9AIG0_9CAEN